MNFHRFYHSIAMFFLVSSRLCASISVADPLFSESFGTPTNPAILLNAGAGSLGLTWSDSFCAALCDKGYYVIRYDYRDAGKSQHLPYEDRPYCALDLAHDTVAILKHNGVQKATYVGFSMGGQVTQIAAVHLQAHVQRAILISTSWDFEPAFRSLEGQTAKKGISSCHEDYAAWIRTPMASPTPSAEEQLARYLKMHWFLDGKSEHYEEDYFRSQAKDVFFITSDDQPYIPHGKSMKASYDQHTHASEHITCPTLIIQGALDPVFPPDHGQSLHKRIQGSELIVWDDFGHALSPRHFKKIVDIIHDFMQNHPD